MVLCGWLIPQAAGCGGGGPARVAAPAIDPERIAACVFEEADHNGDGLLAGDELAGAAAIKAAVAALDQDRDTAVSREELSAWLAGVRDSRVAMTSLVVTVTQKGRPLPSARVRLVPLPCMGEAVQAAEGTTDAGGIATCGISGSAYPGVHCGLYRVEISGNGLDGKPLGEQHAGLSRHGLAVGPDTPAGGMAAVALE
jgi:hypothetical protein